MKHLLTRAYAAQRYFSWRVLKQRQAWGMTYDYVMVGFYFFLLALLALAGLLRD